MRGSAERAFMPPDMLKKSQGLLRKAPHATFAKAKATFPRKRERKVVQPPSQIRDSP